MKISTEELVITQKVIGNIIKIEFDEQMIDFAKINRYTRLLKEIDSMRRILWNGDKFGVSDKIADNCLDFCSDDIPF